MNKSHLRRTLNARDRVASAMERHAGTVDTDEGILKFTKANACHVAIGHVLEVMTEEYNLTENDTQCYAEAAERIARTV